MSWRFRRTKQIIPGVRVNFGKRGASLTLGGKAGRVTVGPSGTRVGASLPGTGVYATQKVGSSSGVSNARTQARQDFAPPYGRVASATSLLRLIPPKEPGAAGLLAALFGSPKRHALRAVARAAALPSAASDAEVASAVAQAPESWTAQREAGFYFVQRHDPASALSHFAEAANRFPGDRTLYYLVAADTALDAGNTQYAVSALEPYVSGVDPESDVGVLVLSTLAKAYLKAGDGSRSLELLARLPLRKQNLSEALLSALCIRACANRSVGKKAQAKKDIDRVYAHSPSFPMLAEAAREALSD